MKSAYQAMNAQSVANQCASEQTEVESILGQINNLVERASMLNDRACGLGSKLLGEIPSSGKDDATVRPCRSGVLGEIRDRLDVLSDNLSSADAHLSRVRSAV